MNSCYMVGPQPPPRHGVSAVNEALLGLAKEAGAEPQVFNTSPASLNRGISTRLARLRPAIRALTNLRPALQNGRNDVVYCSVSSGLGILTEWPIVRLAQKRGARIILHHHSFRYLDQFSILMQRLICAAGNEAIHVLLSPNMEQALRRQYPEVKQTVVVSNAAFTSPMPLSSLASRTGCRVIGHLSNLSSAKGLFEILELAEWADKSKLAFEFQVAGPFENKRVGDKFLSRARALKNLHVLGPLYGEEKQRFFEDLDAFVFPTKYRNEAEPLVILEALSHGCPVISYDRGCISSLVDTTCGVLASKHDAFLPFASNILQGWQSDPVAHRQRRIAAREKFIKLQGEAAAGKQKLLDLLCGNCLTGKREPATLKNI